jgi:hypothetical protein
MIVSALALHKHEQEARWRDPFGALDSGARNALVVAGPRVAQAGDW